MDVTDYLRILRSRWLIVLATVVVALAAGWFTTSVAKIAVSSTSSYSASTVLLSTGDTAGLNLETVALLAEIEPIAAAVAEKIGYAGEPLDLADDIAAVADQGSGTLTITAAAPTANRAELLADTWTTELIGYLNDRNADTSAARAEALQEQLDQLTQDIAQLQRRIAAAPGGEDSLLEAELQAKTNLYGTLYQEQQSALSAGLEPVGLDVLQQATAVPDSAGFQPPRSRSARMLIALLVGLVLGVGLALLVERARSPIRTKEAAERHFGHPVIAEIPSPPGGRANALVTAGSPGSRASHAFRLLAATLTGLASREPRDGSGQARGSSRAKTILVTSPGPREGKTTVVANISAALADLGKRVLILSCDFHRPTVHEYFGVPAMPGLAESLASSNGRGVLDGSVWASTIENVRVVPSGRRPSKPGELLSSGNMSRALEEAQQAADIVILDTAPLLAEGDAVHLLSAVDTVLIVARVGKTTERLADRAHEFLERLDAPVAGVVLTDAAEASVPRRYYDYSSSDRQSDVPSEAQTEDRPERAVGDFPDSHDTTAGPSV